MRWLFPLKTVSLALLRGFIQNTRANEPLALQSGCRLSPLAAALVRHIHRLAVPVATHVQIFLRPERHPGAGVLRRMLLLAPKLHGRFVARSYEIYASCRKDGASRYRIYTISGQVSIPQRGYKMPQTVFLLATLSIAAGILILIRSWFVKSRRGRPLPGPTPMPFFGNLFHLPKELPWVTYRDWSLKYGEHLS